MTSPNRFVLMVDTLLRVFSQLKRNSFKCSDIIRIICEFFAIVPGVLEIYFPIWQSTKLLIKILRKRFIGFGMF